MSARYRRLLPLLIAVAGCASAPAPLTAPRVAADVELAPFAMYLECMALTSGERVAYRFSARAPVDFNVHFREGNAMIIPVEVKGTLGESGDFAAQETSDYCLMWEAGAQGSVLEYRVQAVRPRQ
jgi:hypothetical protein